ncbi:hypothetical protein PQI07_27250 [Methylobacterium sp. 092160098-2]|uniref:hypothetical protein n=1 Tax=Methylobacterium sp. 092160098-2 TaxID=3025129 RepID=UPI002381AD66|nr:hypothetical protein [Methylobacterium sp. 092160098-2]MDE4914372.1 hypothetical protein [Methylobacterium sp. 092160098-2]
MGDTRTMRLLALATTALRDLSMDWPASQIAAADGAGGLDALLVQVVAHLRGMGIDDENGWDTAATRSIPVAEGGEVGVGPDEDMLATAATALRDLEMGYRHSDIVGLDGLNGLDTLLRGLATRLRGRGIDDEGGWDCPSTEGIPVASTSPSP